VTTPVHHRVISGSPSARITVHHHDISQALAVGFIGAILWALVPASRPVLADAIAWLQTVPAQLGEFWYAKLLYYPAIVYYFWIVLVRFVRYQKPQR
jgi:hypothetical protein